jgi:hypothetical protein
VSYFPLPDLSYVGSTPGAASGEIVDLTPVSGGGGSYFTLPVGDSATVEVRVVASGWIFPNTRAVQTFVLKLTINRDASTGLVNVRATGTPEQFGDAAASSWTMSALASGTVLALRFTTGSTTAIVSVVADLFVTRMPTPNVFLASIPVGPVEAQRADLGLTLNAGNVAYWADQTSFHSDLFESTPADQPPWTASNASFNNQPTVGASSGGLLQLNSGTLSLSSAVGWTMAIVFQWPSSGGDFVWRVAPGFSFAWSFAIGASSAPGFPYAWLNGTFAEYTGVNLGSTPGIVLGTFSSGGTVDLYVNGTTLRATAVSTAPIGTIMSSQDIVLYESFVAEQVLWPRVLSGADISQYMNYASARYNIPLF